MDVLRHHRSLVLLILVLITYIGVLSTEHPHRHHHSVLRESRENDDQKYYYVENPEVTETGEWGPWTISGECSRSCGVGVNFETRECYTIRSDGSRACRGAAKRYFSCNIFDCPDPNFDFRAYQCSLFDSVSYDGIYYKWIPYMKSDKKCQLNCMPRNEIFYHKHKELVIDGTRCDNEKTDICVNGKCVPIGCDRLLGSPAREDKCRICNGGDRSCNTIKGILERDDFQVGYHDLLLIPAGATNIRIREIQPSGNYLAVRNLTGHYYLNGNWKIDFPKSLQFAGTVFQYERISSWLSSPERLTALGPITESLYIVTLYQERNTGIEYEYSVLNGTVSITDPDGYYWTYDEFSNCSVPCGGGYRVRNVWCIKRRDSSPAASNLCDPALKPIKNQTCAEDSCPPKWVVSEWSKCSHSCGLNGTQNRTIHCEQIVSNGRPTVVENHQCTAKVGDPPASSQLCNTGLPCPSWYIGPWKACDKLCGDGFHRREVRCYYKTDSHISITADSACQEQKPESEKPCFIRPCEGVDWIVSEWSGCEKKCDVTTEMRRAMCSTIKGNIYSDEFCKKSKLPKLERECRTAPTCEFLWFTTQWSQCSSKCGRGVQTRKVFCGTYQNDTIAKVDDSKCDLNKKYETNRNCTGMEICRGDWFAGPWSACSKPCGGGTMTRKVFCFLENKIVDTSNCDPDKMVFWTEPCNNKPCGKDEIMPVTNTKNVIDEEESDECEKYSDDNVIPISLFSNLSQNTETNTSLMKSTVTTKSNTGVNSSISNGNESISSNADINFSNNINDVYHTDATQATTILKTSVVFPGKTKRKKRDVAESSTSFSVETSEPTSMDNITDYNITDLRTYETADGSISSTSEESISFANSTFYLTTSSFRVSLSTSVTSSDVIESNATLSLTSLDDASISSLGALDSALAYSVPADSEAVSSANVSGTAILTPENSLDYSVSSPSVLVDNTSTRENSINTESWLTNQFTHVKISTGVESSSSNENSNNIESFSSTKNTDNTNNFSTENFRSTENVSSSENYSNTESSSSITDFHSSESPGSTNNSRNTESLKNSKNSSSVSSSSSTESSGNIKGSSNIEIIRSTDDFISTESSSSVETSSSANNSSSIKTFSSIENISTDSFSNTNDISTTSGSSEVFLSSSSVETTRGSPPTSIESQVTSSSTTESYLSTRLNPLTEEITNEMTTRHCLVKKKKSKKCETSEFGCCFDGKTFARGPFSAGCPEVITCNETTFGCCLDGVTPAEDEKGKGCPKIQCNETLYGCCQDQVSTALGNDYEGCLVELQTSTALSYDCKVSQFGCCPDGISTASGPNSAGCYEGSGENCEETKFGCCPDKFTAASGFNFSGCLEETTTDDYIIYSGTSESSSLPFLCQDSEFGCCADNETAARGPNFEGCNKATGNCSTSVYGCCSNGEIAALGRNQEGCEKAACESSQFGCCGDNVTAAHGPYREGCCLNTKYGCCPDYILAAVGPNFEGCGCRYTPFGCCPDNITTARGPKKEGCRCEHTEFGCCPDKYTAATGPNDEGCPCYSYQFGCCPDGVTRAKGPHFQGCSCEDSQFGCCSDGKTSAQNENRICTCEASEYGCCPDGINEARGENFQGCKNIPLNPGEICVKPKDHGPCRNFTVQWFFDLEYGGCSRFWYGGCEGNANRFKSLDECKNTCIEPVGRDTCFLPKVTGPCDGYYLSWYYDPKVKQCRQFKYGGCLGNNNKFQTYEECERLCAQPDRLEPCEQTFETGLCEGNFTRWYYDKKDHTCHAFKYGGCKGNQNNFLTEAACQQQCLLPGKIRPSEVCRLPKDKGPCPDIFVRWYYNSNDKMCAEFVYGGCLGNLNRFESKEECLEQCSSERSEPSMKEECFFPQTIGNCTEKHPRWFFDSSKNVCVPFYYSGCDSNANNFYTRDICEKFCLSPIEQKLCTLPPQTGECHNYTERWYFNNFDNQCRQFYYGGCGGNGNNFLSEVDCHHTCMSQNPETSTVFSVTTPWTFPGMPRSRTEICHQPSDSGPCSQPIMSWYFDSSIAKCKIFMYGGCGGNQNRFESETECDSYCGSLTNSGITVQSPNVFCESAKIECENLKNCPYGIEKWVDKDGCEKCGCSNPCRQFLCPSNQQCSFDMYEEADGNISYKPICRLTKKLGDCPTVNITQPCGIFCRTDADCVADNKCCWHACGFSCVSPLLGSVLTPTVTEALVTTTKIYPPLSDEFYPPRIDESSEPVIESEEGNYVTFKCSASGNPKPVITWQKGVNIIDRSGGRYKVNDGILQVVGLHKSDSGSYICTAKNGVGQPVTKEFKLLVRDGVERPAEIVYDAVPATVVTLGASTTLQCYAYGYPNPTVTWWKEDKIIPMQSDLYEQRRDHSLVIYRVLMRSLGPYTCQAYNGLGRAASWTITLHAVSPVLPLNPEDLVYSIYLVPPPRAPPQTDTENVSLSVTPGPTFSSIPHREFSVTVRASIETNEKSFVTGSDISIPCNVDGYPIPQLTWYKNDERVINNERVNITESNRLLIHNATTADSGVYKCEAVNEFSSSASSIYISVEGVYINPNCTDNRYYANCTIIVEGRYCRHKYYAKFCCRSCSLAGQLPLAGEHFDYSANADLRSWRRKRQARHARDLVKFLSLKNS